MYRGVGYYLVCSMYFLALFAVFFLAWGYAVTDPLIKEKKLGIDFYLEQTWLVRQAPERFSPVDLADASESISYWTGILPYSGGYNKSVYLVIPQLWLVAPIVPIPVWSPDYHKMINGERIEINTYLQKWLLEYVDSTLPGRLGKRIDFGHSNYYANDPGAFKTIFSTLMALDTWDQIWYFLQATTGYTLYKYDVVASYPTSPENVSAMQRDGSGADALLVGCIYGTEWRWLVEATASSPVHEDEEILLWDQQKSEHFVEKVVRAMMKFFERSWQTIVHLFR